MTTPASLGRAVSEIEAHVHATGWDAPPALFALVTADRFVADDPAAAARLGIDAQPSSTLVPIEQESLPDAPLDEALAGISWPDEVAGCALTQEIVVLPPQAQGTDDPAVAAAHPERREARLVVGVLRDGSSEVVLRLRPVAASDDAGDDVLTGPDLAPNLVTALLATLS